MGSYTALVLGNFFFWFVCFVSFFSNSAVKFSMLFLDEIMQIKRLISLFFLFDSTPMFLFEKKNPGKLR